MAEHSTHSWEQMALQKLLLDSLKEQRRRRRWGIFFKLIFLALIIWAVIALWPDNKVSNKDKEHVALVEINGEIADDKQADGDHIIKGLKDAFKDNNTQAIILRINSPGGSPVQASNIYNEIRFLKHEHPKIKVYVVCSDLCASAAYYIASAGDEIYANPSSLVGSIGVILDSFGFVDGMHKIGVERRLFTAGAHKGFLDPFSPLKPDEQQLAQALLDNVHQQFIHDVEQGRGSRLKTSDPNIFSGMVWTGSQALPLGVIDGFGDLESVSRDVIKNTVIVDYTTKPNFWDQVSDKIGTSFAGKLGDEFGMELK